MHVDRDAELAARPFGEAHMVEVRMGEHDGGDIGGTAPDAPQGVQERVPGTRDAGVDDGQATVFLDQIPVGVAVLDPVDARGYVRVQHRQGLSTTFTHSSRLCLKVS